MFRLNLHQISRASFQIQCTSAVLRHCAGFYPRHEHPEVRAINFRVCSRVQNRQGESGITAEKAAAKRRKEQNERKNDYGGRKISFVFLSLSYI